jgi:uncharacterized membrane protein
MTSETARIEAFSDGVFAIAITLLVLELKVPFDGPLSVALRRQWPSYIAFLLSFTFIGIMWVNHHRLFTQIRRADDGLLFLNLLLLGVTVVPFPTSVLARHLGTAEGRTAAAVFNGTYVVIAIFFNVLWRYAIARRLLHESESHSVQAIARQYAVGPLLYLTCFLLSWWSVPFSLLLNLGLAIFFALPARLVARR